MGIIDDINLLLKLRQIIQEGKKMKAGWKTTEFWATLLGIIGTLAGAVVGYLPPELVVKIITGLIAVYTVARAVVKLTPSTKDDELVAKIGEVITKLGGKLPEDK